MGCWKTTIAALLLLLCLQQSNGTYFHYPYFHYLECLCIVQCRRSCIDLDNDDTFVCDVFSAVTDTKWVLDAFDRQDDNYCVPENWEATDYSKSSDPLPFEGPLSPWNRHTEHIPFWGRSYNDTVTITNTHTVNACRVGHAEANLGIKGICSVPKIKCEITDYPDTFLPGHTYQIKIESFQKQVYMEDKDTESKIVSKEILPIGLQVSLPCAPTP